MGVVSGASRLMDFENSFCSIVTKDGLPCHFLVSHS